MEPVDVTPLRVSTFWPGLAPAPATTATSTAPPSTTPAAAPATTVADTAAVTTPSNVLEMLIQCLAETDQLETYLELVRSTGNKVRRHTAYHALARRRAVLLALPDRVLCQQELLDGRCVFDLPFVADEPLTTFGQPSYSCPS